LCLLSLQKSSLMFSPLHCSNMILHFHLVLESVSTSIESWYLLFHHNGWRFAFCIFLISYSVSAFTSSCILCNIHNSRCWFLKNLCIFLRWVTLSVAWKSFSTLFDIKDIFILDWYQYKDSLPHLQVFLLTYWVNLFYSNCLSNDCCINDMI